MITIQRIANGYIYTDTESEGTSTMQVFEEDDTSEDNLECVRRLLFTLIDDLGVSGSKHDARRIRVEIVKQKS